MEMSPFEKRGVRLVQMSPFTRERAGYADVFLLRERGLSRTLDGSKTKSREASGYTRPVATLTRELAQGINKVMLNF